MICRMCLNNINEFINIFRETDNEHNISEMIGKYFWFKPKEDDPISTFICTNCWLKLYDFHEFYKMVDKAHRLWKNGENTNCDYSTNKLKEYCSLPYKSETYENTYEMGELPFLIPQKDNEERNATTDRDILSDNIICNEIGQKTNLSYSEIMVESNDGNKREANTKINESKLSNENKISQKSCRRQNKISKSVKNVIVNNIKTPSEKRRGRPKKEKGIIKTKKSASDQEAYKAKIIEYDAEIAKYMSLYCDICNNKSDNFPALRIHMRESHNIKEGYVNCCDKKFNKRALLLYHIRQHLNPSYYRCEECDFTFSDRQSKHNHFLVKHQRDEDKIYACSQCSKKFVRKYLLEQHKSFSHRDFIPKCKNCGKRFKAVEELTEHHNKEDCNPGTMCDVCAKYIRGSAAFKRHQLEHQGVSIPKVQCDLCGLWYKDKRGLKRHKIKHIEAKQPHVCDICQKISPSRSAMLSHKRYAHGTDRTHECNVCQKTFKKPISLREHMTTHTGEVLYKCPHCTKTFNSNANMHSHRKKVHPKEFEETRKQRKQNKQSID
ncbi:transcription factor grauzone-like isoform X1 [Lucilia sericata]|uniref:transcription factor grauzone-like isoform X1 n=2 Tax=Lucilia sericata TaxID=13632 RepID=UPI0018A854D0|nr:transcription factor grauzone-like isoform X1 [Lucilia sericata]